jgi:hypothetical protein
MTRSVLSLQAKTALLVALATALAVPFGSQIVASVAVGGVMQIVNLRALERSVAALLGLAQSGSALGRVLLAGRWLLFLTAVALVIALSSLHPIALIIGLSTSVPAVLWHGLEEARLGRRREVLS